MWHIIFRVFSAVAAIGFFILSAFLLFLLLSGSIKLESDDPLFFGFIIGIGISYVVLFTLITLKRFKKGPAEFIAWLILPWLLFDAAVGIHQFSNAGQNDLVPDFPIEGLVLIVVAILIVFIIAITRWYGWFRQTLILLLVSITVSSYFVWQLQYMRFAREYRTLDTETVKKQVLLAGSKFDGKPCMPPLTQLSARAIEQKIAEEKNRLAPLYTYLPDTPPVKRFVAAFRAAAAQYHLIVRDLRTPPISEAEFVSTATISAVISGDRSSTAEFTQTLSNGDWIVEWVTTRQRNGNWELQAKLYGFISIKPDKSGALEICKHIESGVWLPPYSSRIRKKSRQRDMVCQHIGQYKNVYHKLQEYHRFRADALGRYETLVNLKKRTKNKNVLEYKMDWMLPCF